MIALLLWVVIVIVVLGVILWALSQFPMDATLYRIARVVIVVIAVLFVVYILASLLPLGGVPAPIRR